MKKNNRSNYEAKDIELIVLAGFMRILGEKFISRWRNKIVNVHPSLLPAFKGAHAIKEAWEYGVKVTGVTIHYVDERMDEGDIIAQKIVNVTKKHLAYYKRPIPNREFVKNYICHI